MPRMAKWQEKYECVKVTPKPVKFVFEDGSNELKTHTIYELIDETFKELFPKCNNKWFDKFVEAKNLNDYVNL